MYLKSASIQHIKGLSGVELRFDEQSLPGWHVILGDNSAGKTTLIRAIALAFVGEKDAAALREDWSRWIAHGQTTARVTLELRFDMAWDTATGNGRVPARRAFNVAVAIGRAPAPNGREGVPGQATLTGTPPSAERLAWGTGRGWFSASFGPARRLAGGSGDYQRIFFSNPRAARHLSAFSEEVALSEALEWLIDRKRAGQDHQVESIIGFINSSELLPHGVRLASVTDRTLLFEDGEGVSIDVRELSDGYRSVLSLTLEMLRQMDLAYGLDSMFDDAQCVVRAPGVVLIDEVDAHLHPSWQETVGAWFTTRFPYVQFIVATHSPLVCRSIGKTGKVFRLRTPGSGVEPLVEIEGEARDILWYGSLERALGSEGFALELGRSEYGWERVEELRQLSRVSRTRALTSEEGARLQHLRAVLADAAEVSR
jgi:predicted ATPase